ncbi:MAG: hypothetical protein HFE97_03395 [Oscillospiraceae bacterium]|nr:hypothetical protein [Oscillospiraceae bacterium]
MDYISFAYDRFQEIVKSTPANGCSLLIHENGALVDAGSRCPGGWMTAKLVLEALTGGRGQVGFAQRMVDGAQFPAVELFLDDPEGAASSFAAGEDGVFGVRDGDKYALGVSLQGAEGAQTALGNLLAAGPDSLLASVLSAASLIPKAVEVLHTAGICDIQWGWSSCPVAPFFHDAAQAAQTAAALHAAHGTVNLWVRGDKAVLQQAASGFSAGKLILHELATACTYLCKKT